MSVTLNRTAYNKSGIFGELEDKNGKTFAVCLEHAYPQDDGTFQPKLPAGMYTCKRGLHTLDHHPIPFEAFEVMNVPGHQGILFHIGNFNKDSDGCVLLGTAIDSRAPWILLNSKEAFDKFMGNADGVDSFQLTVKDKV